MDTNAAGVATAEQVVDLLRLAQKKTPHDVRR